MELFKTVLIIMNNYVLNVTQVIIKILQQLNAIKIYKIAHNTLMHLINSFAKHAKLTSTYQMFLILIQFKINVMPTLTSAQNMKH